jgi:hypothetical protein
MRLSLATIILSLILFACTSDADQENTVLLQGTWEGREWLVFDKDSGRDANAVQFVFGSDGRYSAAFGEQVETGTFRLRGDKLYTTADQKIEKLVKVLQLNTDTLLLGMNRMGQDEKILLVRHSD